MTALLDSKPAIITGAGAGAGAGSGLGRGIAKVFGREGCRLVLADISGEAGAAVLAELRAKGVGAVFIEGDVSHPAYHQELVEKTKSHFGHLDIAVNNAGSSHKLVPLAEIPPDTWDRVIAINLPRRVPWPAGSNRGLRSCVRYGRLIHFKNMDLRHVPRVKTTQPG